VPDPDPPPLKSTPLAALHAELGARMVPFAGWSLPVQYPAGIIAEHRQCRERAALFDVSHMGQASLHGSAAAAALEALAVGDLLSLRPGRQRYSLLTTDSGGIFDDFMVANLGDRLFLVVNASRAALDFARIESALPAGVRLERHPDRALLALQGPLAAQVMARLCPSASLPFMAVGEFEIAGTKILASRSGYTGEDGFELSVAADAAETLARLLLAQPEVAAAGLGARDSLRLEAGLPLYGQDLDEFTTPIEAGLAWALGKRRRMAWDFPGAATIRDQFDNGPPRLRVGLRPEGRAPVRAGVAVVSDDDATVGLVSSGTFLPTLDAPIAMAFVQPGFAADGTQLSLMLRGKSVPATVVPLPFVPHRYAR
jgi:glycine cleavage system T protein (aminomethyltransferase)